jgi:gamma-glutamylcyclotransferase (GGCT)/AIG2-like uncharacterized protein YtfP
MHWWHDVKLRGHLDGVLSHYNEAMDSTEWAPTTHVCDLCFRALNKYWNAFNHHVAELKRGDISSFTATLKAMPSESKKCILEDAAVRNLVALSPPVMNHDVLKKAGYIPGQEIADSLKRDATEEHRKLQNAFNELLVHHSEESVNRALKWLAELLYVIRSNIAHGEKTPYGPDLEKAHRDQLVSAAALPVQRLILDLLLDRPSHRLAAYGTLQPGGPNSQLLEACRGAWESCTVNGEITEKNGLPVFRYSPSGPEVAAKLLTSAILYHFWGKLDRFEGTEYVRHLIPVHLENACVVANVYEQRVALH